MPKNLVRGALCVLFSGAMGAPLYPETRTVTVEVIADEEMRMACRTWPGSWTQPLFKAVQNVSVDFEKRFGIKFRVTGTGRWASENTKFSLRALISGLCPRAHKGGAEVLVAFTSQPMTRGTQVGGSTYEDGIVVVRREPGSMMENTLKHELCHLFGALDIMEKGSVMDPRGLAKGDGFDEFTAGMIMLYRLRAFEAGTPPWAGIDLDLALARCLERQAAHPAEIEVLERMTRLYYAKKEWAELRRVAALALTRDPSLFDLHNMLGIAYAKLGEDGPASAEFSMAIRLSPGSPEAYLNLAGCASRAGDYEGAEDCYRKALEVMPDCSDAHRLFGEYLEGRGRSAEAVGQYRAAISIDPRLERELGPRIKKLP